MQNDERRTRDDQPESNAAFHTVPGDLADTENAAARENRLGGPGASAAGSRPERQGADAPASGNAAPPVTDEAADPPRRARSSEDGNLRDAADTWTTKGNPLA